MVRGRRAIPEFEPIRNTRFVRRPISSEAYLSSTPPIRERVSTYGKGGRFGKRVTGAVTRVFHVVDVEDGEYLEFDVLTNKLDTFTFVWPIPK